MSKLRRFQVDSLAGASAGARIALPAGEAKHARVLRLETGTEVELLDGSGRSAVARLEISDGSAGWEAVVISVSEQAERTAPRQGPRLVLATAWPKGKRGAFLVEKCTELGADEIIPVQFTRSVVTKRGGGEGLERFRRIAAQAAKQCGRPDIPVLSEERSLTELLAARQPNELYVLLDPDSKLKLSEALGAGSGARPQAVVLLVGPEGGVTAEECASAERAGAVRARLGSTILRVETAGMAGVAGVAGEMERKDKR